MGAAGRHMTVDMTDAGSQAADILFLIKFAKTLKNVDAKEVAVIGYSWGGTGALLAAAQDQQVRALVVLDGSFRYGPVPSVDLAKFTIPLLFFSRGETPLVTPGLSDAAQKANGRILDEWIHGDLFQIRMLAISHIQFSSLYQRSERFKSEGAQFVPAGYSLKDGDESYGWIARYTMEFLEAYLKHDKNAHAYLMRSPLENEVPSWLMMTSFRLSSRRLPSRF
jgi:pimeloyl-ACP methyl ester carboxylesterase